jgi:hypothetical protein
MISRGELDDALVDKMAEALADVGEAGTLECRLSGYLARRTKRAAVCRSSA